MTGSGGKIWRVFYTKLLLSTFAKGYGDMDIVLTRPASLDAPFWSSPESDIFSESACQWNYMNPDLPKSSELLSM